LRKREEGKREGKERQKVRVEIDRDREGEEG